MLRSLKAGILKPVLVSDTAGATTAYQRDTKHAENSVTRLQN